MDRPIFDKLSFILTLFVFIGSFVLFGTQSADWSGSLFAAFIASGLFWISYVIVRWLVLALKK